MGKLSGGGGPCQRQLQWPGGGVFMGKFAHFLPTIRKNFQKKLGAPGSNSIGG
jgi:hypothetical protein